MKLSIIILNYNTTKMTLDCINSLKRVKEEINFEIIVIDNGSLEPFPESRNYKLITNPTNLGFAGGNNTARGHTKGEYILFLNSDTLVYKNTLKETIKYLDNHPDVGALTCKLVMPNGKLDKDARRRFPFPWIAFTHFSYLDRLFPKSGLFSRYWYGSTSPKITQEVDVIQGAYFLTRKKVLDKVDWFSEDYFLDGEDIDLCWKIRHLGLKIIYYPLVSILHIKKASKRKRSLQSRMAGVNSMEIFYKEYLWEKYPLILNFSVILGIYFLKIFRFGQVLISK